ncbi:unnamed protein product [Pseudo-nitzschia multistriata]|uniref:VLRF1 domain-containing protein n=1 Tax=Pseudo-nitzschia multistriata TaxID=183589 RepID=A0A448ZD92_9STRA|nr:unnamed protein product [Pseudo-nitzschia multistriata]
MGGNNKQHESNNDGENRELSVIVRRRLALYEEETTRLLRRAHGLAKQKDDEERRLYQRSIGDNTVPVLPKARAKPTTPGTGASNGDEAKDIVSDNSSSDGGDGFGLATIESEDESESENSSSDEEDEDDEGSDNESGIVGTPSSAIESTKTATTKPQKTGKLSGRKQKRLGQDINRHADNLIRVDLPLPPGDSDVDEGDGNSTSLSLSPHLHLFPAAALLPNNKLLGPFCASDQAGIVRDLSETMSSESCEDGLVVVLLIQSGRFAGGVFRRGKCLAHRATTRYTIRKGQGKAQSVQDGSRRPKSIGSQLRRAGEEQLNEDVKLALTEWTKKRYIADASLLFLACPKTMRSTVFSPSDANSNRAGGNKSKHKTDDCMLSKDDDRIRKIPFDVGRATFHNVEVVYKVLMTVDLCHVQELGSTTSERHAIESHGVSVTTETADKDESAHDDLEEEKRKRKEKLAADLPMTPLHVAAREGNLTVLLDLVHKINHGADDCPGVDQPAGYSCSTPLHFAAAASKNVDPVTASAIISALLIQARADPTVLDASGRPPYFLAGHDKIREGFRKARAALGEDYCDWDSAAKVGPPLTESDLEAKKKREAEKKRRKKARQKEKKEKDRAAAREAEERRAAEEEARHTAEEAKRIRDQLPPKPTAANACDFCGKICKGRNASKNMFRRLDYKYCSTECVNKHKRELMAAAAMARFG